MNALKTFVAGILNALLKNGEEDMYHILSFEIVGLRDSRIVKDVLWEKHIRYDSEPLDDLLGMHFSFIIENHVFILDTILEIIDILHKENPDSKPILNLSIERIQN